MNILVCISHVPDTTTKIKFNTENNSLDTSGVQWIINPWDELALTRAVELKEDATTPIQNVVVVNVGDLSTEPTLRKCLAVGADEAWRIDVNPMDAYHTALQLADFIKTREINFIVCGIESSDYNSSAVGGMLAELLDIPSISSVSGIQFENNRPVIHRDIAIGKELVNVDSQVVLIAQKGFANVPRIPNMRGIMTAKKKPLNVIKPGSVESFTEYLDYELPGQKTSVKLIEPENIDTLVEQLSREIQLG